MNVEGRKCREHIFETRTMEGITFHFNYTDPIDSIFPAMLNQRV